MRRLAWVFIVAASPWAIFAAAHAKTTQPALSTPANGWQIPETAREEKSPLSPTPGVLKNGKSIYDGKCAKCHGPQGKGDGPDSDKEHPAANLSESRGSRNPDGVLFYKIWNGRKEPKMPAFKSELTKDEAWAVVEYAKSLRTRDW